MSKLYYLIFIGFLSLPACGSKQDQTTDPPGDPIGQNGDNGGNGTTDPNAAKPCVLGGCSGTLCVEPGNDVVSTCEYKPEYECYKQVTCERQTSGQCGFTETAQLESCIQTARAQGQPQDPSQNPQ